MKMKKLLATLLAACLLLSLAVVTGAAAETAQPVTVEFWHAMSGGLQTALVALTDKFNAENGKGITVNLTNQGGYGDLSTKLLGAIASDTLPDMAQVYDSWIVNSLDVVVPLDDFVANDFDNYEDILPGYRAEGSEFGRIYTIGFNKSVQLYFYNKTKYDELGLTAPTTWEELYNVSKAYYEGTGTAAFGYDDLFGMFLQYMLQNDAGFIENGQVMFSNEKGVEAMAFLLDMFQKGYARTAGEDKYLSGPFNNGLVGAYIGSSAGAAYIKPVDFEYACAPIPVGVKGAAMQAGTNLAMFAKDAAKQAAAWEYIKFLTSTESTVQWAMNTGYLPVRQSGFESAEFQAYMANSEAAKASYAQVANMAFESAFPGSQEIRTALGAEMETAILEGKTAEQTIADMAAVAQGILDRQ
jgi:multiple sugar transport system substrate-binding protein